MHWILSTPSSAGPDASWLEPFVPGTRHSFQRVPGVYHHDRSRKQTNTEQWRDYFTHGRNTWAARKASLGRTGIITLFPQLPVTVGLHKRLSRRHTPLLAWTFNLGSLYGGHKRRLARFALAGVDRFIVHSRREIQSYSEWLDLPPERFRFVPLQRPVQAIEHPEDDRRPFVLAMGSAHRDYRLFLGVMGDLGYPTIVVAGAHALAGLSIPSNVEVRHRLSIAECNRLTQQARINVVPVDNPATASGQVTLIDAMMYGRPTVATHSIGTEDYAQDGITADLVAHGNPRAMKEAIRTLWEDAPRRATLGAAARHYVETCLSDDAAGRTLASVLDELEDQWPD
ncbi:MAG: glycosyltransferase [Rhodocyclaceae bacterium]|nr:MAG: glycosyltransferase [Rhodocyclaceae bacterium]